jgi:hypothetical protein
MTAMAAGGRPDDRAKIVARQIDMNYNSLYEHGVIL